MEEIENPQEPLPVLPLNYAGRENKPMRLVLRAVATIFVVWQFNHLLTYLIDFGSYLWEQNDPTVRRKMLSGVTVIIRTPQAIVALYLAVNSPGIIKLTTAGRRWIIVGSGIQGILSILYSVAMAVEMVTDRQVFLRGWGYGAYYTLQYAVFVVTGPLEYFLILSVFRTQAARDVAVI